MKNEKKFKAVYVVVSLVTIAFIITSDMALIAYKQFYLFPILAIVLNLTAPIIVSVLSFIKIVLQKKMPVQFSRVINIIVVVLFSTGIIAFYHPLSILTFVIKYLIATFVFCLQLCALAYDFFPRKKNV